MIATGDELEARGMATTAWMHAVLSPDCEFTCDLLLVDTRQRESLPAAPPSPCACWRLQPTCAQHCVLMAAEICAHCVQLSVYSSCDVHRQRIFCRYRGVLKGMRDVLRSNQKQSVGTMATCLDDVKDKLEGFAVWLGPNSAARMKQTLRGSSGQASGQNPQLSASQRIDLSWPVNL